MTTFRIPSSVCKELDSLVKRFWWGAKPGEKFLALKAWKDICKPKAMGGLGFRLFKDINTALLAKLGWKLATGEDCLWTVLLRSKYLRGKSFFDHGLKKGSSYVWQSIISSRPAICRGACFKIGDGRNINPWSDPWVPNIQGFIPKVKDGVLTHEWTSVADFKDECYNEWNEELIRDIFAQSSADAILSLEWPRVSCQDRLLWIKNQRGEFSVKECYFASFFDEVTGGSSRIWIDLWNTKIHERLKIFLWRLLANVLPTRKLISQRIGIGDQYCTLCGGEEESAWHLFFLCPVSRLIAFGSHWGCLLDAWSINSIEELVDLCVNPPDTVLSHGLVKKILTDFVACLLYSI